MSKRKITSRYFVLSLILSFCSGFSATSVMAASLAQTPLNLVTSVDSNILINLSVETPMGGAAYNDQDDTGGGGSCTGRVNDGGTVGICYFSTETYVGYFDPDKCYTYTTADGGYFTPTANSAVNHACSSEFSGNFMNWATMTAMDAFVFTMTGGNRVVDTAAMTIVERAKKHNNDGWFPHKLITSTRNVTPSTVTPWSNAKIYIKNTDTNDAASTNRGWEVNFGTTRDGDDIGSGPYNVRIRVCESAANKEDNCVKYTSGTTYYKPEGLIQQNAESKRFAVSSYLKANTIAKNGGVLRAKMKYVGPEMPAAFGVGVVNQQREWNTDGIYVTDPDSQVGSNGIVYSGVVNYLNKFTREHGHKVYDPVSELFYESVHYFRGQGYTNAGPTSEYLPANDTEYGHFPAYSTWDDPIQYWCQKNFIVAINDSFPHRDKRVPGSYFTCLYAGEVGDGANDCGQPSDADTFFDARTWTNLIGGFEGRGAIGDELAWGTGATPPASNGRHNSNYIAGLAYQAHVEDLRPGVTDFKGDQTITTFMIDTQEYNSNPLNDNKSPLWLTGKYGGFTDTLVVDTDNDGVADQGNGVFDSGDVWDADNDTFPDNYVLATKPKKMVDALNKTFSDIDKLDSSSSAVVANSVRLNAGTQIFQAKFNSGDWSGELVALPLDAKGKVLAEVWNAKDEIDGQAWDSGRNIFTYDPVTGTGEVFTWSGTGAITAAQQDALHINPDSLTADTLGQSRLQFIRGDTSLEGTTFRDRAAKLGDMVNSAPVYVGGPSFAYPDYMVDVAGGEQTYTTFANNNLSRTPILYVGGNDGMLHGIRAVTTTTPAAQGGEELMAYIPGFLLPELNELTSPGYSHRYYVDGSPTVGDVFMGLGASGAWHTVLAGGARAGGQGFYLLDITDPTAFTQSAANASSLALWEFTDAVDADLGYSFSQPAIVKMQNDKWAVIFGNGYHNTEADGNASTTGHAVLYIVFVEQTVSGTWSSSDFVKIDTGAGTVADPNGLSTPAPVDIDGDNKIDYIYAGDLYGNMWKFDVTHASNTAQWKVDYKLFTAEYGSSPAVAQPITVKPDVGFHPTSGYMVYFGTGKFFEDGDSNPATYGTQTFYGVWDNGSTVTGRSALQEQEITDGTTVSGIDFRVSTNNTINWSSQYGWYMDLPETGEQVVVNPQLNHDLIVFVTQTPSADPCDFGGTSWVMEMNATNVGWPLNPNLDVNGDGIIDGNDTVDNVDTGTGSNQDDVRPTGTRDPNKGILTSPTILPAGDKEYKYSSGSTGGVMKVIEAAGIGSGRQSWEQIR